jgi:hypothetical protein
MTTTTVLIVCVIALAFILFSGVLAWGDFYSGGVREEPLIPGQPASSPSPTSAEDRRAA